MKRCGECEKWRMGRGYCPVYATRKGANERMCAWMANEVRKVYMRGYFRKRRHGSDELNSPIAGRALCAETAKSTDASRSTTEVRCDEQADTNGERRCCNIAPSVLSTRRSDRRAAGTVLTLGTRRPSRAVAGGQPFGEEK